MSNPKPSRKALDTRKRLLKSAVSLFSRKGYDGTSVDEIVARAKVNKRMVYHYFGNKEGLYREVLREVYALLGDTELRTMREDLPPEETICQLVRAYFEFLESHPEFVNLLLWENLSGGRHLQDNGSLSKAPVMAALQKTIQAGVESGRFRKGIDARHLLIHLIGLCLVYFSNRHTLSSSMQMDMSSQSTLRDGLEQVLGLIRAGLIRH